MQGMSDIVARLRAAWQQPFATDADPRALLLEAAGEIERLRLTDAEREAIGWAAGQANLFPEFEAIRGHAATLRGLLERTK